MKRNIFLLFILTLILSFQSPARAAKKVLIIGDSHTHGYFGEHLLGELSQKNLVSLAAAGGSNAQSWVAGWEAPWGYWEVRNNQTVQKVEWNSGQKVWARPASQLQKEADPDLVAVALGTNHFWFIPENPDMALGSVERLINEISNFTNSSGRHPTCVWIAPPMYRIPNQNQFGPERIEAFYQGLKALSSRCQIFWESRNYIATGLDGIHFHFLTGNNLARQWAQKAAWFIQGLP